MDKPRQPGDDADPPNIDGGGAINDTSSEDQQPCPPRKRASQHSAPEPTQGRNRSVQSRVSFDSEPSLPQPPTRTRRENAMGELFAAPDSEASDSVCERPTRAARPSTQKNTRKLDSHPSFMQPS